MFHNLTLRGGTASIVWGYRTAAVLSSWSMTRTAGANWSLSATIARADPFNLRRRPLLFTAPGLKVAWGVETITVGARSLVATLAPPEK